MKDNQDKPTEHYYAEEKQEHESENNCLTDSHTYKMITAIPKAMSNLRKTLPKKSLNRNDLEQ